MDNKHEAPADSKDDGLQEAVTEAFRTAGPISQKPTIAAHSDLRNRFTYHSPKPDQLPRYEAIRAKGLEFAELIAESLPHSLEQTLAIRAIENAVMWANAAIARNE